VKANPGGQIDNKDAIGRGRVVTTLWETIEQQSVIIAAERRIGKTTVLNMLKAVPGDGWVPVYQELEKCVSAMGFAMAVYKEIAKFLGAKEKITHRVNRIFKALGGAEIAGIFKLPPRSDANWKDILENAIEDLIHENDGAGTKLLFLWDEVPYMLDNIKKNEGEQTAIEVLDLLRSLRQTHNGLRMIFTGSIGLHHVLHSLKGHNPISASINDMIVIEVPPLGKADAVWLASQLIIGENLKFSDLNAAALEIGAITEGFPFYIHCIVKALRMRERIAEPEAIRSLVSDQLTDVNDPWHLQHFRERIRAYYPSEQNVALLILDELASRETSASADELLRVLKERDLLDDREHLLDLLSSMGRDHYLKRDTEGKYQFQFQLIRRWWKLNRSL